MFDGKVALTTERTAAAFVPEFVRIAERFVWSVEKICPVILAVMAAAFLTPFRIRTPSFSKQGITLFGGVGKSR